MRHHDPDAVPLPPHPLTCAGVLFDIDGTLTDSDPLHLAVFRTVLAEEQNKGEWEGDPSVPGGQPVSETWFRRHIAGRHNPTIVAELFPSWSVDRGAAWSADKEARFRALAAPQGALAPLPGLLSLLDALDASGIPYVAVTNAPGLNAEAMLDGLGIRSRFVDVVLGERCVRAKPDPEPYLEGLRRLGLENRAAECVAFEDSPSGARAAVAAGLGCWGVSTGQAPSALLAEGCGGVVRDFTCLPLPGGEEAGRGP